MLGGLLQCLGHLRLDGGTHERDLHVDGVGVGQRGGVALAGDGDVRAEVHRGALDVAVVLGGVLVLKVERALDLEVLADHPLDGLGEEGHGHNLVQGNVNLAVGLGEFVHLTGLGGEVLGVELPELAGTPRLENLFLGVGDSDSYFISCSHRLKTTVKGVFDSTQAAGTELIDVTFADLTTLHVGGKPRAAYRCTTQQGVIDVVGKHPDALIVGGGSNLLVADGPVDCVAVIMAQDNVVIEGATVRAEAGARWDDVVRKTVEAGLGGIECLSGIPGSAGATPVQNVGAYGAEIADVLRRVKLFDRRTGAVEWVDADELELSYRYSNLKFTGRAVVLEIELELRPDGMSHPLRFGQLAKKLGASHGGERRPAAEVREAVLELRRGKGMVYDPADHDTWSAGSFFTNPIVDSSLADTLPEDAPRYPADDGQVKLSAAWLIDKMAGFNRGYPGEGAPARLSTKHTLALTNRGSATAADIAALARTIRDGVYAKTGIELRPEPVWVGLEL